MPSVVDAPHEAKEVEDGRAGGGTAQQGIPWTPEALERLERVPEFVRPMACQGIEHYARSHGRPVVDEDTLAEA